MTHKDFSDAYRVYWDEQDRIYAESTQRFTWQGEEWRVMGPCPNFPEDRLSVRDRFGRLYSADKATVQRILATSAATQEIHS
jgi:hypothetical protein